MAAQNERGRQLRRPFIICRAGAVVLYFFTPESRRFLLYSSRSAALTWPNMTGAAGAVVVAAAAVAAAAFGFVAFLAKAPEVETARIARQTRTIFFMLSSPLTCAAASKSVSLMGGADAGLIWLIEPPQGGQPSFLRGRNKMRWIRRRQISRARKTHRLHGGRASAERPLCEETAGGPAHRPRRTCAGPNQSSR
jgi:hypothetical protein